jgi:CRP-like cAMP-binding protein
MIDKADLARVEVFSQLPTEEQERFAQKAADVRSAPAETIVYQGEQSKFYVILEGSAQVFKDIHGVLHPLGKFTAGDFFGGLNCLMGISSGVAVIATTQCRVARFELQQLQELIQPSARSSEGRTPDVTPIVGTLLGIFWPSATLCRLVHRGLWPLRGQTIPYFIIRERGFLPFPAA